MANLGFVMNNSLRVCNGRKETTSDVQY